MTYSRANVISDIILISTMIFLTLMISGCSGVNDSSDDPPPAPPPQPPPTITYSLSTEVNTAGAGSISPSSGRFDEGEQVQVQANANKGWTFLDWTGDILSNDNPLIFTITHDTKLTANFIYVWSEYSIELSLADGVGELDELGFGQTENPYSEFAPPQPPEDVLYAYFLQDGENLFKDFRSNTENHVTWELHYQALKEATLTLKWNISAFNMNGSLTLTDSSSSLEINMLQESSFEFVTDEYDYFQIIYLLEQP